MGNQLAESEPPVISRRPRDDEIDVYGLTHPGKIRTENQDHFLVGSLRGRLNVQLSSLPNDHRLPLEEERVAFFMVALGADGKVKRQAVSRSKT